ncbi:ComEA family DNA-binding protein [Desulfogranum marinum]|uniref:ComEA family DNA-binding protein n=1 Tax=Desulfogranum marinum TaxID=453220 RepID=UPI0019646C14|nr:helix-hairpin-helix domain-containing protein [Desulfogranum marinum]MBM9514376.1 helix-hairpin-helix domain-containing protein [Desulfogranum marinum]
MKTRQSKKMGAVILTISLLVTPATILATDLGKTAGSMTDMADQAAAVAQQLNVNTASVDALANIPGIGEKVGQAIAAYREANGAFTSLADLVNVDGIDAALLEKIKPFLSI